MKVVEPKVYVAPNGKTKVRIFHHGFVEPVSEIDESSGKLIQKMSVEAKRMLGTKATPFQVFEYMGWKPV